MLTFDHAMLPPVNTSQVDRAPPRTGGQGVWPATRLPALGEQAD